MIGRKYVVAIGLVWILILSWGLYLVFEGSRMAVAEQRHHEDMLNRGLTVYAENCVVCHGPVGEGVVGPPLDREGFRGDPLEDRDTFDLIYKTLRDGRPGTAFPRWELLVTGEWASYTAMPAFGVEEGGPLNDQALRAVTTFIMSGNWNDVWGEIPQPMMPADRDELLEAMPDADALSAEANLRGKEIFVDKACITCHVVGAVGGFTGPDLSRVGAWGLDEPFLRQWISDPAGTENRAPVYWSNYVGPLPFARPISPAEDISPEEAQRLRTGQDTREADREDFAEDTPGIGPDFPMPEQIPLPPTQMPQIPMTDEELDALVEYLMHLGR